MDQLFVEIDALAPTVVPGYICDSVGGSLSGLISTPLFGGNVAGASVGSVFDVSENAKEWIVQVSHTEHWSSGKGLIAQDFAESIELQRSRPAHYPYGWLIAACIQEVRVEATSRAFSLLRLRLKRSIAHFSQWLESDAFLPIPPLVRSGGRDGRFESSGPYEALAPLASNRGYVYRLRTSSKKRHSHLPDVVVAIVDPVGEHACLRFDRRRLDLTCCSLHSPDRVSSFLRHESVQRHPLRLLGAFLLNGHADSVAPPCRSETIDLGGLPVQWCDSFVAAWKRTSVLGNSREAPSLEADSPILVAAFEPNERITRLLTGGRIPVSSVDYSSFIRRVSSRDFASAYCLIQAPFDGPSSYLQLLQPGAPMEWAVDEEVREELRQRVEFADACASEVSAVEVLLDSEKILRGRCKILPVTLTEALYLSSRPGLRYCQMGKMRIDGSLSQ